MTFVPTHLIHTIFFPGVILDTFFSFLLIYGCFRVGVLGSWFLHRGFQLMGFRVCVVGPSGFSGVGAVYKNKEE